jgi:hypothetical protein
MPKSSKKVSVAKSYSSSYSKRPLWQWILLYFVIAGVLYYLAYYMWVDKRESGYDYPKTGSSAPTYETTSY